MHSDHTVRIQHSATPFALGARAGLRTMLAPSLSCAFRPKAATQSGRKRPPDPEESGHLFRLIPATCPG